MLIFGMVDRLHAQLPCPVWSAGPSLMRALVESNPRFWLTTDLNPCQGSFGKATLLAGSISLWIERGMVGLYFDLLMKVEIKTKTSLPATWPCGSCIVPFLEPTFIPEFGFENMEVLINP